MKKDILKKVLTVILFFAIMGLTYYTVFNGQDFDAIFEAIKQLSVGALILSMIAAFLYVACEGFMIWLMIPKNKNLKSLLQCIGYAFINFFYSGITPSASGGQPMQLYYLKQDGYSFSKSCAVLTVIAAMNKLVLASLGIVLLVFWNGPLNTEFAGYMGWYYLGLGMLIFWVFVLGFIMLAPGIVEKGAIWLLHLLEKIHILKPSETRDGKVVQFFDGYRSIKSELESDKHKLVAILLISYIQRIFLISVTYITYRGFGLEGSSFMHIMLIQLAIMVTVDMLPLPGAQGISEFMYKRVFENVFTGVHLTASMCVTRLVNFYFLLIVGILVVIYRAIKTHFKRKRQRMEAAGK